MTKIDQIQVDSINSSQKKTFPAIFVVVSVIIGVYLFMIGGSPFSLMLETNFLWYFPAQRLTIFWQFIKWLGFSALYIVCIVWLYKNKKIAKDNIKSVCYILTPFAVLFFLISFIFGKPYARPIDCPLIPVSGENPEKQVEAYIWEKDYWNKNNDNNLCKVRPNVNGY